MAIVARRYTLEKVMDIRFKLNPEGTCIACTHNLVQYGFTRVSIQNAAKFCEDMRNLSSYLQNMGTKGVRLEWCWGKLVIVETTSLSDFIFLELSENEPLRIQRDELLSFVEALEACCLEAAKVQEVVPEGN